MVQCVSILGSTGSIGRQSLDVIRRLPGIRVAALTAGTNVERMAQQCREFSPKLAVMATQEAAQALAERIKGLPIRVNFGEAGLMEAASMADADCVITAVVGMVGLKPTLAAIRAKKRIGLANKETLVCAGELVMAEAERCGAEIVPVDSEHSAIFQCLMGCGSRNEIRRLILTCSGGPFFGMTRTQLETVTKADALKHPNWKMGAKITVDCATLMNKGLEVIEAMRLYRLPPEQVDVVIHRQSIVHSMVEFTDGAVMAQMGSPDMRLPIQLALTYPQRFDCGLKPLDFEALGSIRFLPLERKRFPCYDLALSAAEAGDNYPCALNAAGEIAVGAFLKERIPFTAIAETIEDVLQKTERFPADAYEALRETDARARRAAEETIAERFSAKTK